MHVLSVSGLTKGYEGRTLFSEVSFGLSTEDHVGVVGANGSGKSTLLALLAGREEPDDGEVVWNRDARLSLLEQDPRPDPDLPAIEVARGADRTVREHEAEAMLDVLGIGPATPVGRLSGGQRRRVALAAALLPPSDLLVLDEPTNHLDVDTIDWLEEQLRMRAGGVLMVTHDRYFLERLTNRMIEIDDGEVFWHEGTYSTVLEARAERRALAERKERRRQNLLRKEIAWLRRGPKARSSKPKFRLDQVAALQDAGRDDEPVQLNLGTGRRRLGSNVLELDDVSLAFGDHVVLHDVSLGLGPGDRVGVVGPNGAGKTTLLHVMTGQLSPDAGSVKVGQTVEFGVYEQEASVPPSEVRVIDTLTAVAEWIPLANGERLAAHRLAERFGFDASLQQAAVARLSGGERRRLALLHMLVAAPNVLVLDEPTNDLDLDTLNVLEDHLDGFGGTLIVASHDRYVLDRLTDGLYAVTPGGHVTRHLDWDEYRRAEHARRQRAARDAADTGGPSRSAQENRERQEARRRVRSLEQRMDKLAGRRDELHRALASVGADYEAAAELDAELAEIEQELAEVEERWLEMSVEIDA